MGRVLEQLFSFLLWMAGLGVSLMLIHNFAADEPEVDAMARAQACEGVKAPCDELLISFERSSLGRSFRITVRGEDISIRCRREHIVFGEYRCTRWPPAAPPVAASSSPVASSSGSALPAPRGGSTKRTAPPPGAGKPESRL
ncbi:hypothetical protein WMF37_33680 [Sorangium sp. So ce291]|uniref:hypothetical protein n=1 Tax=Sorangium sp. So ce291 TaxID=3133294 RepID=UPI003F5FC456